MKKVQLLWGAVINPFGVWGGSGNIIGPPKEEDGPQ